MYVSVGITGHGQFEIENEFCICTTVHTKLTKNKNAVHYRIYFITHLFNLAT